MPSKRHRLASACMALALSSGCADDDRLAGQGDEGRPNEPTSDASDDGEADTAGEADASDSGSSDAGDEGGQSCEPGDSPQPWTEPPFVVGGCGSWEGQGDPLLPSHPGPAAACGEGGPCPTFVDVTEAAGLSAPQFIATSAAMQQCMFALVTGGSPQPFIECEPEWMTGGVAVGDFDADGWPDLYVTRLGHQDFLYRNNHDGTFTDVAEAVGLGGCSFSNGALWVDIDADGDLDLFVTTVGDERYYFYRNDEGCFVEDAVERGLDLSTGGGLRVGQSVTAGDYDGDGALDLHVNEWVRHDGVLHEGALSSRLLHNDGTGHFEDVTETAGVAMVQHISCKHGCGMASTFVDLDADGLLDLVVAADFNGSRLFWNEGDGSFSDGTELAAVGTEDNAMGSTFADFDGDGRLDWFVSSITDRFPGDDCEFEDEGCLWRGTGNRLFRNLGGRAFEDVTTAYGVRESGWAWGASAADFDNNGLEDIVVTNGWKGRDLYGNFSHHDEPTHLFMNHSAGAALSEEAALRGVDDPGYGRSAVSLDYDLDGDLDIFITNQADRPTLYRNEGGNQAAWLQVDARQLGFGLGLSGARGARVELQLEPDGPVQIRHIGATSHYLGEPELVVHFGLGDAQGTAHELRVYWANSDEVTVVEDVELNQRLVVTSGE